MTVYVDKVFIPATVQNGSRHHTSRWCHLTADSTDELIEFAKSIGLRPGWIQHAGTWMEHFDVTEGKRWQAIRKGAVEVDSAYRVKEMLKKRGSENPDSEVALQRYLLHDDQLP